MKKNENRPLAYGAATLVSNEELALINGATGGATCVFTQIISGPSGNIPDVVNDVNWD